MTFWSPKALLLGVLAMLAAAAFMMASVAQQDAAAGRQRMVEEIDALVASAAGTSGVARLDPRVRAAMAEVPRHDFVPPEYRSAAYANLPLPIGDAQTISQPLIVALMTELLQPKKADSGYQAAILSLLAGEVYTIEIVPALGQRARASLERLGYSNVWTKSAMAIRAGRSTHPSMPLS